MSWPTGIDEVRKLIDDGSLEKVSASQERVSELLDAAQRHLASSDALASSDPEGAYSLLYDAARKALAAVLQAEGLRATSRGGQYALQQAIYAQFHLGVPATAFRTFGRLRRTRNHSEYEVSSVIVDDVQADLVDARRIVTTAARLAANLPVFTD